MRIKLKKIRAVFKALYIVYVGDLADMGEYLSWKEYKDLPVKEDKLYFIKG